MKPVRVSAYLTALVLAASGLALGMAAPGGATTAAATATRAAATTAATTATAAATTATATATTATSTPNDVVVDLGSPTGPFDGGASGSLYGIYDQGVPSNNLIEGMGLKTSTRGRTRSRLPSRSSTAAVAASTST